MRYDYRAAPTERGRILVSLLPTASLHAPRHVAPSGVYLIEIRDRTLGADRPIDVWIVRDETLPGYPEYGRQAYFDQPCYRRFDKRGAPLDEDPPEDRCAARRTGTLSGFATGAQPIVAGGYVRRNGKMADYSATGPAARLAGAPRPVRLGPDAAAPCDDSPALPGVLSAGSRCGSLLAMNGTSVAAPQAARWTADRLGAGLPGGRKAVHDAGAEGNAGFPTPAPCPRRAGGGRMVGLVRFGPKRG